MRIFFHVKRSNYLYCHPPLVTLRHRATSEPPRPSPAPTGSPPAAANHRRTAIGPPPIVAEPLSTAAGCWTANGIFGNEQNFPRNLILLLNAPKYTCLEKLFLGIIFPRLKFLGMKIETFYQTPLREKEFEPLGVDVHQHLVREKGEGQWRKKRGGMMMVGPMPIYL